MRKILTMLFVSFVILSCDKNDDGETTAITVPNQTELEQTVYADNTTGKAASHSPLPAHGLLLSMKAPLPARTKHHHRNGFQLIPQAVIRQEATRSVFH